MTTLRDVNLYDIEFICLNMREQDKAEIFGLLQHDNAMRLAYEVTHYARNSGRGKVAWYDGKPAALFAFVEIRTGVWEIWMFGTDAFKSVALDLMRWCRKEANEILTHSKGHRLQAMSRAGYDEAHKLIRAMGGVEECRHKRYGKDGADYICFTWLNGENDAILKPHYVQQKEIA